MPIPWTNFRKRRHRTSYHPGHNQDSSEQRTESLEFRAQQLRASLEALGPRYACFARYLSSRVDLIPAEYCRELACTPDVAPPLTPPEVQGLLLQHFGNKFDSIFERFDYTLQNANLLSQAHPA